MVETVVVNVSTSGRLDLRPVADALRALADALEALDLTPAPPPAAPEDRLTALGWLTVPQAAQRFGVSTATVWRRLQAGAWPSSTLPGTRARRFSPEDVAAIAENDGGPVRRSPDGASSGA